MHLRSLDPASHATRLLLCAHHNVLFTRGHPLQARCLLWTRRPFKCCRSPQEGRRKQQNCWSNARAWAHDPLRTRSTPPCLPCPTSSHIDQVSSALGLWVCFEGQKRKRPFSFGRHNRTDRLNVLGRAGTSPAPMVLSTVSLEDIVGACKQEKDSLIRIPSTVSEGVTEDGKAEGEQRAGVSGGPARITEWFKASRQDLRWLNFARIFRHDANNEICKMLQSLHDHCTQNISSDPLKCCDPSAKTNRRNRWLLLPLAYCARR